MARLLSAEVQAVIWDLQRMKPTDAQGAEKRAKRIRSLQ
jgi:hypothetical protein